MVKRTIFILPCLFCEDAEKPIQPCFLQSGLGLQFPRVQPDVLALGTLVHLNPSVIDLDELPPELGAPQEVKIAELLLLFLPEFPVLFFLGLVLPLEIQPGKILFSFSLGFFFISVPIRPRLNPLFQNIFPSRLCQPDPLVLRNSAFGRRMGGKNRIGARF